MHDIFNAGGVTRSRDTVCKRSITLIKLERLPIILEKRKKKGSRQNHDSKGVVVDARNGRAMLTRDNNPRLAYALCPFCGSHISGLSALALAPTASAASRCHQPFSN